MNKIEQEKNTVAMMIGLYCRKKHGPFFSGLETDNSNLKIRIHNSNSLCPECKALLRYAEARLDHCRFGEQKRACRYCPVHCFKPDMRERMRQMMRFSGPRMIFYAPLVAIRHLFRR